jgi:hypothetical protein
MLAQKHSMHENLVLDGLGRTCHVQIAHMHLYRLQVDAKQDYWTRRAMHLWIHARQLPCSSAQKLAAQRLDWVPAAHDNKTYIIQQKCCLRHQQKGPTTSAALPVII